MSTRCPRLWEAEAARDARLSGQSLAAYDAHVTTCRECARERRSLDALARGLRDSAAEPDEVSLRRLRVATLERAFAASRMRTSIGAPALRGGAAKNSRWAVRAAGLAIIAAIGLGVFARAESRRTPSIVVTTGHAGQTWTRRAADGIEHVELSDGLFSLVVRRRPEDRRVIVRVPEGEIEDFGTAFDVRVDAGRTVRIAVREGVVVFRQRGERALRLSAGMVWSANDPIAVTRVGEAVAPGVPAVTPQPPVTAPVLPRALRSGTAPALRGGASIRAATQAPGAASAASDLAAQEAAQDGAYLHVLALLREHRGEEARLAAIGYLKAFPNGFRRVEMQRIAHAGPLHRP